MIGHEVLLPQPGTDALRTPLAAVFQRAVEVVGAGAPVGLAVAQEEEAVAGRSVANL